MPNELDNIRIQLRHAFRPLLQGNHCNGEPEYKGDGGFVLVKDSDREMRRMVRIAASSSTTKMIGD